MDDKLNEIIELLEKIVVKLYEKASNSTKENNCKYLTKEDYINREE